MSSVWRESDCRALQPPLPQHEEACLSLPPQTVGAHVSESPPYGRMSFQFISFPVTNHYDIPLETYSDSLVINVEFIMTFPCFMVFFIPRAITLMFHLGHRMFQQIKFLFIATQTYLMLLPFLISSLVYLNCMMWWIAPLHGGADLLNEKNRAHKSQCLSSIPPRITGRHRSTWRQQRADQGDNRAS